MKVTCLKWLALAAVCMFSNSAQAGEPPAGIPLWEQGAPGFEARAKEKEVVDEGPGKCNVANIHNPSITPYLPKDRNSKGLTAVLIAPGGGHRMLCMGHEGYGLGEWFADHGIAAFVLKYRLAREQGSVYTVDDHAMADTRRALRLIRDRSEEWGIHPDRIGVLGFSAGGELAALAAMDWDLGNLAANDRVEKQSCRPAFQALIYPGSSKRFAVTDKVPPAFIALGYKDRDDISIGMAELYLKYKAKGVPAELHIYSNAGHGFGYREGTKAAYGEWPTRLREWLIDSKLMD
ncbi:MAG: alpha/beta hydrolase [Pirellulales bacterium]